MTVTVVRICLVFVFFLVILEKKIPAYMLEEGMQGSCAFFLTC